MNSPFELVGKVVASVTIDETESGYPFVAVLFTDSTVLMVEEGGQSGYLLVRCEPPKS